MGLEAATYISQLVETNPTGADDKNQGDNHLRMIKAVLKTQFPNLNANAVSATVDELNKLDGLTATTAELNIMDGVTATTAEINKLDGLTATATELNKMDGCTATTTELNRVDGVTSNIQTQLNAKAPYDTNNFTNNIWTSAGGFIIQWGIGTSAASGKEIVGFTTSFGNVETVLVTDRGSSTSVVKSWCVDNLTETGFDAYVSGGGAHTFNWVAFGRVDP